MCGICGFTGLCEEADIVLNNMMNRLYHRGPDSFGTFIDKNVALGFRRLSFIDLADGNQPMYNEDETVVIVFNGEIYNYKKLRQELTEAGHSFKTMSDTEVLVHAYEEYGEGMLNKLRGMFAFVIYDKNKNEIFAARDFFGIKPFYYSIVNDSFLFASEIKSFLEYPYFNKELNEEALEYYLSFQYSVLPETFFKGVFKLMPGHFLRFKDGKAETVKYFEPSFETLQLTLEQTVTAIDETIQDSIKKHRISDVEVGSFLSSGVDSSYVASCFGGGKTFTVGFDYDKYNEIEYAKTLSEQVGLENFSKTITTEEYWDVLPKVQYYMDEPLADPAAVALYFVSQLASQHVKGAMSGEGADEFFGGYKIYREPLDLKILTDLPKPLRKFFAALVSLIPFKFKGKNFFIRGSKTVEERFIGNANIFSEKERQELLLSPRNLKNADIIRSIYEQAKDRDDITKMQLLDINLWLVGDILLKADKMSMANSLEVRVPFLDKEVFKIASRIPTDYRVNRQSTKYAFRRAANRHLPEIVANKKKLGFPVPIRIWLRDDKYFNVVREAFESETACRYFKRDKLIDLLEAHKSEREDNSRKIWTVYMFLLWHGEYFTEQGSGTSESASV